ncbi:MAG: prolyl oligopeptidase family serine peptidase [Bacteroidia bacterium]|nr:prolyl oligopeptidase family serine peptidase [Bacteroidia bacterium]
MVIQYPETQEDSISEDYFGTQVADPYRWLEEDTASDVADWVVAQNEVTFGYLKTIPFRDKIRSRLEETYNYPKASAPFKVGEFYFIYKNDGLQNQAVIYRQMGINGEAEVFLDPNAMSGSGTVAVNLLGVSRDDRYIAYSTSAAGSDWQEIHVKEVATGNELADLVKWVKFSGAAWHGDGFFYTRFPAPESGKELSGASNRNMVYYHKLGTKQAEDQLIFEDPNTENQYYRVSVTEDEAYLILYKSEGATVATEVFVMPLADKSQGFQPMFTGFDAEYLILDHREGTFWVKTNKDAPTYRLVSTTLADPKVLVDILPARENVLESVSKAGNQLFAQYMVNATNRIFRYDYDGQQEQEISLPGLGSSGVGGGKKDAQHIFYLFTGFTQPTTIYRYDIATSNSEVFFQPALPFDPNQFETRQEFFSSKDGTRVSMFLVHKKGLSMDGKRPTYLYGYGGFNVNLTPSFSSLRLPLLENDGVYVMVNLRGGGEYGEEWHEAGMLANKQHVFDDFIAAAEHLISSGVTSTDYLACAGGSNGGLLVGAVINQRPDLFRVAFPAVGVMDMLRYHKFTVGWGWVPEYGQADRSKEEFEFLYAYSPIHNIRSDANYPSVMVTTADHDDRVVPAHSFKYAATLQKLHTGTNPTLIRIETDAGHGAGKPTGKILDEYADEWAFFFHEMGITSVNN